MKTEKKATKVTKVTKKKVTKPKKHVFVVDRAKWMRGGESSTMLRGDGGKQCCLGFVAQQLGCSTQQLYLRSEPQELTPNAQEKVTGVLLHAKDYCRQTLLTEDAMTINDDSDILDEEREARLKVLFASNGHEIQFKN